MMQLRSGMSSRASTSFLTKASALLEGKQMLNSLSVFPGQKIAVRDVADEPPVLEGRVPHRCPSAWHRGCQCRGCAVRVWRGEEISTCSLEQD
jgi:hypothetical protein